MSHEFLGFRAGALLIGACLAIGAAPSHAPSPFVTGRVVTAHGEPIAGAKVALKGSSGLTSGVTDSAGRFIFRQPPGCDLLVLSAEAAQFVSWGGTVDRQDLEDLTLVLDLRVDAPLLDHLLTVATDEVQRRLEAILAVDDENLDFEVLFPYLGVLHEDLRAMAQRPVSEFWGMLQGETKVTDRALELLAFWSDPADQELLASYLATHPAFRPAPEAVTTATEEALCSAWAELHFRTDGVGFRSPTFRCHPPVLDRDGRRALLFFEVSSVFYRYDMYVIFGRSSRHEPWRLMTLVEGITDEVFPR